jgi:hypothetical protein
MVAQAFYRLLNCRALGVQNCGFGGNKYRNLHALF